MSKKASKEPVLHVSLLQMSQRPQPVYPHSVTVHEHKAPTDESVRLLKEMQEKALASILGTFSTGDNTLHARWFVLQDDLGFAQIFICRYRLNGVDHEFRTKKEVMRLGGLNLNDLVTEIVEDFQKHFSRHFLKPLFDEVSANLQGKGFPR